MKQHKHDFDKLRHVATKYYRETNCCAVIAVAAAAQVAFGKAYRIMQRLGRPDRKATPHHVYEQALRELGYRIVPCDIPMGKTLVTAKRKCPKRGTFLILTHRHITCIHDGEMVDWAADTNSRKRIIWVREVIKDNLKRG